MKQLQKRISRSTELSLRFRRQCELPADVNLDDVGFELDELHAAHIKQEQATFGALLDLLESSPHCSQAVQQRIVRAREQLAKIGALLAVGLKHSLTRQ